MNKDYNYRERYPILQFEVGNRFSCWLARCVSICMKENFHERSDMEGEMKASGRRESDEIINKSGAKSHQCM